jgi:hypothetical protein
MIFPLTPFTGHGVPTLFAGQGSGYQAMKNPLPSVIASVAKQSYGRRGDRFSAFGGSE